jgi:membrane protease YdiL (CAAX protease family)
MKRARTYIVNSRTRLKSRWILAWLVCLILVLGGVLAAMAGGHSGFPLVVTALAFFTSVAPYSALVTTSFIRDIRLAFLKSPYLIWAFPAAFVTSYGFYAAGTNSYSTDAALRLALFVGVPTTLTLIARRQIGVTWLDAMAVAAIWIPFDLGGLASIWSWPAGEGAYVINTAIAIVLAAVCFIGLRRFPRVNLRFSLNVREIAVVVASLSGFMMIAIPFGFKTDFIGWHVKEIDVKTLIATPLGILFFIAIPEEFLFRGLVQNMLSMVLKSEVKSLIFASLFFGMTHLNNEPIMDWRYVTLATVAGLFYGHTYNKCRSIVAPALVHTMVDTLWVLLFLKPH